MKFVKWFEEIGAQDVALVGGKNASLGEMIRNLGEKGVNVPPDSPLLLKRISIW